MTTCSAWEDGTLSPFKTQSFQQLAIWLGVRKPHKTSRLQILRCTWAHLAGSILRSNECLAIAWRSVAALECTCMFDVKMFDVKMFSGFQQHI